jgi:hypothetical protein
MSRQTPSNIHLETVNLFGLCILTLDFVKPKYFNTQNNEALKVNISI